MSRTLTVPELSLVVLVGTTGSGKSTFARRHFKPTQIVSSDACRGVVSDDENDQSATAEAFALLHHIAGLRLRRGLLTVVDATSVQPKAREALIKVAREHDVLPVAIVLDLPENVCRERNALRPDRAGYPPHVITRQHRDLRSGLRGLEREGFRKVHILRSVDEVDEVVIEYEKAYNDKCELTGPFDVIGDVHGCRAELESLLVEFGYAILRDTEGRPIDALPPTDPTTNTPRTAVFVGDLVDRGPDTPGVLRLVMGMVEAGHALCVPGNHENKLVKALTGRKVQTTHGLAESLEQLAREPDDFRTRVTTFCKDLISHYVLDGGRLVVAHAGLKEAYQGRASGRVRSFALYGETTGETDEYGLPIRYSWAEEYRGKAMVLYGHTPVVEPTWVNNTLCLDTGCVFGGKLTALRYPERDIVSVPAQEVWYEPARPLEKASPARDPGVLDLGDVLGRRTVDTALMANLVIQEENAAAALEVMSRFAVDPRWLIYLPPTMAPVAASEREGYLEYPDEAFAYFRASGVTRVVCEEKHMGSRAVVVLARGADAARERFGVTDGSTGVVVTRTGRPFFDDPTVTETLLERIRATVSAAGLWDELETSWIALDCELLPWSAKAMGLVRDQYAAVGAASRAALGSAVALLDQAMRRGLDLADVHRAQAKRLADAEDFAKAYGRYCWPTTGLDGVRLAPFQILAAERRVHATRDHGWHLEVIDRICAADEEVAAKGPADGATRGADTSHALDAAWDATGGAAQGSRTSRALNAARGPADATARGAGTSPALDAAWDATGGAAQGSRTSRALNAARGPADATARGADTSPALDAARGPDGGANQASDGLSALDAARLASSATDVPGSAPVRPVAAREAGPSSPPSALFTRTRRRIVDLDDAASVSGATAWWEELTGSGGEGMVVKPFDSLVRDGRRVIQPGVKCRGPEYLRIIYGPEYREPRNLVRLRRRFLGRKQSLALREYALGLEALERFVAREPLYQVHEAVFAVLALESEPVDPRL